MRILHEDGWHMLSVSYRSFSRSRIITLDRLFPYTTCCVSIINIFENEPLSSIDRLSGSMYILIPMAMCMSLAPHGDWYLT